MSLIKTPDEVEKLKKGGEILSQTLRRVMAACVPGASTEALDQLARDRFAAAGGRSSFLGYQISPKDPPYPSALCVSINDEVVHGPATPNRVIQNGDLVGLDIGMWYEGLATDMATTVAVGEVSSSKRELALRTRESLARGISVIREGAWVQDIGAAIEDYLKPFGYGIVRDLVGHGVGHAVHEEPQIPNFRDAHVPRLQLKTGMVLAIEPMIALGSWQVAMKDDGWTIVTRDHSPSAHFEVTVAVTKDGYDLITPWPDGK